MKKIRIILADDHNVLRQGIAQVLESQEDMHVIAQASTGKEAITLIREHHPDIILLDINMPDLNGLEVTQRVTSDFPDLGVIILTMYRSDDYVFKAIEAGARGYLLKEAEMDELLAAVRNVSKGQSVIDSSLTDRVFAKLRGEIKPVQDDEIKDLPKRDLEILRLIAKGFSNKEISEQIFITEKTIRNRLSLLFQRLNIKNRTEAALFAIQKGLVEEE